MRSRFLKAARGKQTDRPPVWMMRQAGRYLPEYREIREEYSFLEAISTPDIAAEISLQPWHRFKPDGVVMYSDILTVLEPLGFSYHLESGVGPVIENPVTSTDDVSRSRSDVSDELWYVAEIIDRIESTVGKQAAVIGFAGGPFTLAAYVCEGMPSRTFMDVRRLRAEHPTAFETLLDEFTDVLVEYIAFQTDSGADVIQLFDTYAGLLSPTDYRKFILPRHQRIVNQTDVPTIVFARNMSGNLDLLAETGADVISLDWTVDVQQALQQIDVPTFQGNLDPALLYGEPDTIHERTQSVVGEFGEHPHILNLGHGVDRNTPVENVEAFFDAAKSIGE
ncbi:uroporphyrinogen decarboxylase [Salinarchaeum sp. IM2453]|uniref:uroporphyrinogen decarboxylase n=1 Tax=Salinarchaeum sp. IM2453 TaxID=2862870 RepID=UPI001C83CA6D|nr:uroporphyrinogen decarboxylase [Salinarchaeum sp. IM2453]QZA88149.1 uroporphyrinogen decarboxylase [Salinarchaeum sp. IM2453]